MIVN
jgi:hypothetical protein